MSTNLTIPGELICQHGRLGCDECLKGRDALLAAAKAVEPQIGWHGRGPESIDKYYCEHCDALPCADDKDIMHSRGCPVLALREAIRLAESE